MALLIESEPIPLEVDANGAVRAGGARITLDTIVAAFGQGATAEEIYISVFLPPSSRFLCCDCILPAATCGG